MGNYDNLKKYQYDPELLKDKDVNLAQSMVEYISVALTAAQIQGMSATPVEIIPAPGAGRAILVDKILFEMTRTSTQFANGGVVTFEYVGGNVAVHAANIPASVINGTAGVVLTELVGNTQANGVTVPENAGVEITNATAAFITGTGTAKVKMWYKTVEIG